MNKVDVLSIRLNTEDNVVVAMRELDSGCRIDTEKLVTKNPIPAGHKMATGAIRKGDYVRKYGQIIGVASIDIQAGDHVHTHNLDIAEFSRDYSASSDVKSTEFIPEKELGNLEI